MLLFNVYIISIDGFNAVARVGINLPIARVALRERTYSKHLAKDHYFVASYEVGSPRDLECQEDLLKLKK